MGKRRSIVICDERGRHPALTNPPQQQESESIAPQQCTDEGGNPRENIPPVAVEVPPRPEGPQPPRRSHKSRRQGQECRDRWKLGVEIFTAVIILAYTTVAALQWLQMRWSLEQAERAWMVFGDLTAPGDTLEERRKIYVADGRAHLMATFFNVGRSPAFHVVVRPGYMILDRDTPLNCRVQKLPGEPESRGVVPNESRDNPLQAAIVLENVTEETVGR